MRRGDFRRNGDLGGGRGFEIFNCGRDPGAAEINPFDPVKLMLFQLQCGRDPGAAEMGPPTVAATRFSLGRKLAKMSGPCFCAVERSLVRAIVAFRNSRIARRHFKNQINLFDHVLERPEVSFDKMAYFHRAAVG